MQDTRTPFIINVGENIVLIVLDLLLYPAMGVTGLALGFSISYVVAAVAAGWDLRQRTGGLASAGTGSAVVRIAVATAVMAGAVALVSIGINDERGFALAARVLASVAVGVLTFVAAARALRVEELTVFTRQLLRRSA